MIPFMLDENLGLVLEPPERSGMDDPVAVALIAGPRRALALGIKAPAAGLRPGRIGGKRCGWREKRPDKASPRLAFRLVCR